MPFPYGKIQFKHPFLCYFWCMFYPNFFWEEVATRIRSKNYYKGEFQCLKYCFIFLFKDTFSSTITVFSLRFSLKLSFQWKLQNFADSWIVLVENAKFLQQKSCPVLISNAGKSCLILQKTPSIYEKIHNQLWTYFSSCNPDPHCCCSPKSSCWQQTLLRVGPKLPVL